MCILDSTWFPRGLRLYDEVRRAPPLRRPRWPVISRDALTGLPATVRVQSHPCDARVRPAGGSPLLVVDQMTLSTTSRGIALRGTIRGQAASPPLPDGVVLVDAEGRVARIGPAAAIAVPPDVPVVGAPGAVVLPGPVDAHVHLAFGSPAQMFAGGVVAVRDLGAPPERARSWRTPPGTPGAPAVAVAGPLLTAPGGYPSRTWGAAGFARPVTSPADAARAVAELALQGVDLVKLALEPAGGQPVPDLPTARAVVDAAHRQGRAVTCHALTVAMVEQALAAGVDELCHTPVEPLPPGLIERIAERDLPVVSTLATLIDGGFAAGVRANARALVAGGVRLVYGTDLGNTGTRPGVDPRELACLVDAGLSPAAALDAATRLPAQLAGFAERVSGILREGEPVAAIVLPSDPVEDFAVLRRPLAVGAGTHVHVPVR